MSHSTPDQPTADSAPNCEHQSSPTIREFANIVGRTVWWPIIPILLVVVIVIGRLIYVDVLPGENVMRPFMEWAALRILPTAALIAIVRFGIQREKFFVWVTGLAAVLYCRELHFVGTSAGVYIGLGLLLWIVMHWYWSFASYLSSRRVLTVLCAIFFLYFVGVTLDRNVWKFIPDRGVWASPLEEVIEVMGHAGVIVLSLIARKST